MKFLGTMAKAVAAGAVTAIATLEASLVGATETFGDLSHGQWVRIVGSALGALLLVYNIPNKPAA